MPLLARDISKWTHINADHPTLALQHPLTRFGKRNAARSAIEQPNPEAFFKRSDGLAE